MLETKWEQALSRLDVMIERLCAQRVCIEWAAGCLSGPPGLVIELGLGSGRTYDHLRQCLPGYRILAFDLRNDAHPACRPDDDDLVLGDVRETLPSVARQYAGQVQLVHADIGTADHALNRVISTTLAPWIERMLTRGGILIGNREELAGPRCQALPIPHGAAPGHCFVFGAP